MNGVLAIVSLRFALNFTPLCCQRNLSCDIIAAEIYHNLGAASDAKYSMYGMCWECTGPIRISPLSPPCEVHALMPVPVAIPPQNE